jgi:hypothetical protein
MRRSTGRMPLGHVRPVVNVNVNNVNGSVSTSAATVLKKAAKKIVATASTTTTTATTTTTTSTALPTNDTRVPSSKANPPSPLKAPEVFQSPQQAASTSTGASDDTLDEIPSSSPTLPSSPQATPPPPPAEVSTTTPEVQPSSTPASSLPIIPYEALDSMKLYDLTEAAKAGRPIAIRAHRHDTTTVAATVAVTVVTPQDQPLKTPFVGDRCRVFFDMGSDWFGRTNDRVCSGWYPGTIAHVTEKKNLNTHTNAATTTGNLLYNVTVHKIQFDDCGQGIYDYPSDALQLISHEYENVTAENNMDMDMDKNAVYTDTGAIFYLQQPETLHVGDLVFGKYQNGRQHGAWFRGRVAAVRSKRATTTSSVCDIAYDDGEYECNIPYGRGHFNVKLIEKGAEHPAWMEKLSVNVSSRRKPSVPTAVIRQAIPHQTVLLEYTTTAQGDTTTTLFTEKKPYARIANLLFSAQKKLKPRESVLEWPVGEADAEVQVLAPATATAASVVNTSRSTQSRKKVARKTAAPQTVPPKKTVVKTLVADVNDVQAQGDADMEIASNERMSSPKRTRRSQRAVAKKAYTEPMEVDDSASDLEVVSPQPTRARPRRAAAAAAKKSRSKVIKEDDDDTSDDGNNSPEEPAAKKSQAEPMEMDDSDLDIVSPQPTRARSRRAAAKTSRSQAIQEADDDASDQDSSEESTPPPAKKTRNTQNTVALKKETQPKKSVPQKRKPRAAQKASKEKDTSPAIAESDYDSDEPTTFPENADDSRITDLANCMSELNFSASNTFGKALNSSDTHLGATVLTFVSTFSQQVPNEQLCKVLLDLTMFGPNSGGTFFPDCHRMENATNYMSLLLAKPGFADKLSRVTKPSFWEDCLDQMTSLIYTVDGDEHRTTAAAIGRIGQSLHVKVCCAELFLALISRELDGFVRKQQEPDAESLCSKPIVKQILAHRRGAKEALEKSVKACTQLWSMYGHFILCDLPDLETAMEADDGPSDSSVYFVRSQASRLMQVMGKLCSYLAWLYGVQAHESTSALAYLINDMMPQELEATAFDPTPFLDAADYSKEVKLNFLLNLDKRCVPQLKPTLAEMLGVATKYNAIFG